MLILIISPNKVEPSVEFPTGKMGTWNIENTPEVLKQCPFTLSRTKKNPHYWFRISGLDGEKLKTDGFRNATDNLNFCEGEILINHSWEKKGVKYIIGLPLIQFRLLTGTTFGN